MRRRNKRVTKARCRECLYRFHFQCLQEVRRFPVFSWTSACEKIFMRYKKDPDMQMESESDPDLEDVLDQIEAEKDTHLGR